MEVAGTDGTTVEGEPEPQGPRRAWYVVHCYSGYENKVKKGLEQRIVTIPGMQELIFRAVVPTEEEIDLREGQRKVVQRRVFPGYILVEMVQYSPDDPRSKEAWYVVRNTPGVTGFVSSGDIPTPLREDEVNKILKRMESDQPKVRVTYRTGQVVHIIDGPFADFRGTVDEVNMEKGKVRVMVSFFGRETPVELDLLQVEKV
ncbi:MAG: transcription termination/antitermination protein NusG [Chloroflexi bacterium]|nr:transcription termination/antitermination protein NusG [Chloroflexota bacterium]